MTGGRRAAAAPGGGGGGGGGDGIFTVGSLGACMASGGGGGGGGGLALGGNAGRSAPGVKNSSPSNAVPLRAPRRGVEPASALAASPPDRHESRDRRGPGPSSEGSDRLLDERRALSSASRAPCADWPLAACGPRRVAGCPLAVFGPSAAAVGLWGPVERTSKSAPSLLLSSAPPGAPPPTTMILTTTRGEPSLPTAAAVSEAVLRRSR